MTPIALALTAALGAPQDLVTVDDLSWMAGYWLSCDAGREVSETWSDPRGGMMAGHGMTIEDGRLDFELSRIAPVAEGLGVGYFAGVRGAPPVIFPAVEASDRRVVFENPGNDFPQRIIYTLSGDALTARIEAGEQGMEWTYRRAELNARCPG